jgi:mRNA interferase MazF
VVLCDAGRGDWLLCQITSNPHSDPSAIRIVPADIATGSLATLSFVRPAKLFTASDALITKRIAVLKDEKFKEILLTTIGILQAVIPK